MAAVAVFDIETDGLDASVIHIAVANGTACYTVEEFNAACDAAEALVGHNIISFDLPVMKRLWNYTPKPTQKIRDTLVMARLADPERPEHNLESFVEEVGGVKIQNADWSSLTETVENRCREDVELTRRVYEWCLRKLDGVPDEAIELEQEVYRIICKQMDNGWLLDQEKARDLVALCKERKYHLEDEVRQVFKPLPTFIKEIHPKIKQDGSLSKVGLNCLGDDWQTCGGPFSRIDYEPFNLGSRQQIARYLQWFGWVPTKFTETGKPQVDEAVLEDVDDIPEAMLIHEYLMTTKRITQVQSWIDKCDADGRVRGYVNPNGCVTGRMSHSGPNMAQVPGVKKPHGKECRQCWIVPQGYKLVGMDAAGLELRMLAHYMNDPDFTYAVESGSKDDGTDVHTLNMKKAGLLTRDDAKTFIYAFLYGAGAEKLGKIVGGGKAEGARLKAQFLAAMPALENLIDRVKQASRKGYLVGLDGRKIRVRSQHAALNSLLQGAGALVMKKALILLDEYATLWGLDYKFIGNIHDEVQAEVAEKDAAKFQMLANACMEKAGIELGLRCKLEGESKIGSNWSETH